MAETIANILDAQDAVYGGQALAEEAWAEFMKEWSEPMVKQQLKLMWMAMPPAQKEAMKQAVPELYAQAVQIFDTLTGGTK